MVILEWPKQPPMAIHTSYDECRLLFDSSSPCITLARKGGEGRMQAWVAAPGVIVQHVVQRWRLQCGLNCRGTKWHLHAN